MNRTIIIIIIIIIIKIISKQTCTQLELWKIDFLWLKEWPFVGVFGAKRTK